MTDRHAKSHHECVVSAPGSRSPRACSSWARCSPWPHKVPSLARAPTPGLQATPPSPVNGRIAFIVFDAAADTRHAFTIDPGGSSEVENWGS